MYLFRILAVCIFITSCGGGGGGSPAVPFALTLASNSFSTDEDTSYSGSFAASANETVTLEYLLTETTSNGSLSFSNTANIVYNPNPNFFGQDEFTYSVTAVEKNITRTSTVTITVAAVNDRPEIFPHEDFEHPFVRDYYDGILKTEAENRINEMIKNVG